MQGLVHAGSRESFSQSEATRFSIREERALQVPESMFKAAEALQPGCQGLECPGVPIAQPQDGFWHSQWITQRSPLVKMM